MCCAQTFLYKIGKNVLAAQRGLDDGRKLLDGLQGLGRRVEGLEQSICRDVNCDDPWQRMKQALNRKEEARKALARVKTEHLSNVELKKSEGKRFDGILNSLSNTSRWEDEEIQKWKEKSEELRALLHERETNQRAAAHKQPNVTAAVPYHCHGLVHLVGRRGSITTGTGPVPDPSDNDCRWIIKSDKNVLLQFQDFHIYGTSGRLTIFAGPKDVERYRNEDVINWASAFRSITGVKNEAPIACPSNEVLLVFKTSAINAERSGFNLTWSDS
mmetsp:Transcript_6874/g.24106  ORF Transcript_6874/g.24106 Transcript_6874/m.24106 type:complete len:272 (-) Transcript_6874:1391-2206(-)